MKSPTIRKFHPDSLTTALSELDREELELYCFSAVMLLTEISVGLGVTALSAPMPSCLPQETVDRAQRIADAVSERALELDSLRS